MGGDAISKIKQLNADLCLMGVNAIDHTNGVTDNDWDVVQVKKAMVASSSKLICLTIAEKLDTYQPLNVCGINQIDYLITELDPGNEMLRPFVDAGICVL